MSHQFETVSDPDVIDRKELTTEKWLESNEKFEFDLGNDKYDVHVPSGRRWYVEAAIKVKEEFNP